MGSAAAFPAFEPDSGAPRLGEAPPEPLSEAELSWIWAGQRFPPAALALADGRSLRVLNPGRPGGGSGPDFLDALFEVDGVPQRGDVELHVRASGFRAHGHDADPAYDGVGLHVVFRADAGAATRLHSGRLVPVAEFAPWLEGRTEELRRWLDAGSLWAEPCRDAVARRGEAAVRHALVEAGERRLLGRSRALGRQALEFGEEEALWRRLLDLLGVGGDREGFRRVAAAFPASAARRVIAAAIEPDAAAAHLTAALLFTAGLGPEPADSPAPLPARLRPALSGSGRPANRPGRRLAAAAALLVRADGGLAAFALESVAGAEKPGRLVARWQVAGPGGALLGPERAREFALNLALAFAATRPSLRDHCLALARAMAPAAPYGKTALLENNLRTAGGKRLVRGALEQQGLLEYLGFWCSRGGCGRCPLS